MSLNLQLWCIWGQSWTH